jgi:6,7-dimethyl-8-ribityllumazine synthase
VPVVLGVLTTDTVEQAMERADVERGDKGADCADAAVEMVRLLEAINAG